MATAATAGGGADVALQQRLAGVIAVRDEAAATSDGRRRVPVLVKLADVGQPAETVRLDPSQHLS